MFCVLHSVKLSVGIKTVSNFENIVSSVLILEKIPRKLTTAIQMKITGKITEGQAVSIEGLNCEIKTKTNVTELKNKM